LSDGRIVRVGNDFSEEYPGADALASECFINLVRVGDGLDSELSRRLRSEAGLSTTALMLLATLDGLGGRATPTEISQYVPITTASITSLIDTNEKKGYVHRLPDTGDRRKIQIEITASGRAVIDRILPGVHQFESSVMSVLTTAERTTLLELLAKISRSVDESAHQPAEFVAAPRIRPEV
jgi:DNA-binding MarR family transcriptional regulator